MIFPTKNSYTMSIFLDASKTQYPGLRNSRLLAFTYSAKKEIRSTPIDSRSAIPIFVCEIIKKSRNFISILAGPKNDQYDGKMFRKRLPPKGHGIGKRRFEMASVPWLSISLDPHPVWRILFRLPS